MPKTLPPDMQVGERRKLINEIAELTGTEDQHIRRKQLSSSQVHAVYEELTGEPAKPKRGRGKAWFLKQILDEAGIETHKSLTHNSSGLSAESLRQVLKELRHI